MLHRNDQIAEGTLCQTGRVSHNFNIYWESVWEKRTEIFYTTPTVQSGKMKCPKTWLCQSKIFWIFFLLSLMKTWMLRQERWMRWGLLQGQEAEGIRTATSHGWPVSIWVGFSWVPQEQHSPCTLFKHRFSWELVKTAFKWCWDSLWPPSTDRALTIPHSCPWKTEVPYFSLNLQLGQVHKSREHGKFFTAASATAPFH